MHTKELFWLEDGTMMGLLLSQVKTTGTYIFSLPLNKYLFNQPVKTFKIKSDSCEFSCLNLYIPEVHLICFSTYLAGEDGQIKIWSKSGMLRSTLASQGKAKDPCFTSQNLNYICLSETAIHNYI